MAKHSGLSKLSLDDLQREVRARQRRRPALERRRARIAAALAALDAQIAALGGGGQRRRGGGNKGKLHDYLLKALAGKTMGVSEAAEAVKQLGYSTSSPNFRVIVNGVLMRKKGGFKRVARGRYTTA